MTDSQQTAPASTEAAAAPAPLPQEIPLTELEQLKVINQGLQAARLQERVNAVQEIYALGMQELNMLRQNLAAQVALRNGLPAEAGARYDFHPDKAVLRAAPEPEPAGPPNGTAP